MRAATVSAGHRAVDDDAVQRVRRKRDPPFWNHEIDDVGFIATALTKGYDTVGRNDPSCILAWDHGESFGQQPGTEHIIVDQWLPTIIVTAPPEAVGPILGRKAEHFAFPLREAGRIFDGATQPPT